METVQPDDSDNLFEQFKSLHEEQLKQLGVPSCKWKCLYEKLSHSLFDAGNDFVYAQEESDEESESNCILRVYTKFSMDPDDNSHIYLIDHAFTYTLDIARKALEEHENLYERMCSIMNLTEDLTKSDKIDIIMKDIWKYNNSCVWKTSEKGSVIGISGVGSLSNQEESYVRYWYILDEFGSAIKFSETPTFTILPFVYFSERVTCYSLLFPIVSVQEGDEVTRSYPRLEKSLPEDMKKILKYPWEKSDLSHIDFEQTEPDIDYLTFGRVVELLPDENVEIPSLSDIRQIKIYSDYPDVAQHLTLSKFVFTDCKEEAHILWLSERVSDYRSFADNCTNAYYVNQFPSEQVLINKDLLAITCRRSIDGPNFDRLTLKSYPTWLSTTFSLVLELPKFISYFQNREKRNLDNTWICKPFNLARGLDIFITDNLAQIIRLTEYIPMVACKYISDPVLFLRENIGLVKMDLRFIVLLKSIQNFELFVYKRFWLRFANKPFSMDDFNDYEKHFTVMNYSEYSLQQMFCHNFIEKFETQYPSYKWTDIEASIHKMIKEVFIAAAMKEHPAGLGTYVGSRAMYGIDLMLEWDRTSEVPTIQPVILEVNWMPDCTRACQYYPEFYNDVFSVLFLDEIAGRNVVQL